MIFDRCVTFVQQIGLQVNFTVLGDDCFLPGFSIENGGLFIDRAKMLYPGDILHEAAHIAVVPAAERPGLCAASIAGRKDREAEEMMAIAWSYAACIYLQIDPGFVFHQDGYRGNSSNIVENFAEGRTFGLPMLQWTGMTTDALFPGMLQWLRN